MGQEDLPWFCVRWSGLHVFLVWGANALSALSSSRLLKYSKNCVNMDHVAKKNDCFKILVFDHDERLVGVLDRQIYGGIPTLVIDVSRIDLTQLYQLEQDNRTIWGFNLPFWFRFITPVTAENASNHFGLEQFFQGSSIVNPDQIPGAVKELVACTRNDSTENLCTTCFETLCAEENLEWTRDADECVLSHPICRACKSLNGLCYHVSHKRHFTLGEEYALLDNGADDFMDLGDYLNEDHIF